MAGINNIREITGDTVIQTNVASQASVGWRHVSVSYNGGTNTSVARLQKRFAAVDSTSSLAVGEQTLIQYRIHGSTTNRNLGIAFQPFIRITGTVVENSVSGAQERTIRVQFNNTNLSTLESDPTLNSRNDTLSAGNRDVNAVVVGGVGFGEIDSSVRWDFNSGLRLPNLGGGAGPIGISSDGSIVRVTPTGTVFVDTANNNSVLGVTFNESGNNVSATVDASAIVNTRIAVTDALDDRIDDVSFTSINQTPSSFAGAGGQSVRVNSGATALEFFTPPTPSDERYFFESDAGIGNINVNLIGQTRTLPVVSGENDDWKIGQFGYLTAEDTNNGNTAWATFVVTGIGGTSIAVRFTQAEGNVTTYTRSNVFDGSPFNRTEVSVADTNTTADNSVGIDLTANPTTTGFEIVGTADITEVRGDRFHDANAGFRVVNLDANPPFAQTINFSSDKLSLDWKVGQWGYAKSQGSRDVEITFRVTSVGTGSIGVSVTKLIDRTGAGANPGTWNVYAGTPITPNFIDATTGTNELNVEFTENADNGSISAVVDAQTIINQITASTTSAAISVFEENTQVANLVNTLRFIGAGVTASETDPGDITISVPESGDFFNHRLNATVNLQALTLPTSVDFSIIPEGSDWVAGDKGYARSSDGLDEFRFTVNTISRTGSGLFRVDIDTITLASGSTRTSWDVDAGPIETRFELAGDTASTRGVVFNRDTSGAVTGSVNVAGLGGGGTGGVVWPFQSGFGNTSPERITFNQSEWQPGDEPTLTLTGVANTGWAEEQYGQLVGTTRNGNTTTIQAIINFRVRSVTLSGSDTVIGVEVVDNLLFTQASLFMNWGIYPGLASFDAASSGSAYTDLDTKFWRTANLTGSEAFQEDTATNLFGRTNVDNSASPPVTAAPGQSVHFSDVESDLQWVPGQFGYTRHSTGNALFTFEVQAYDSDTNRIAVEIVDIIRNTLGQFANRTSTVDSMNLNRWAIFAGSPTPEVMLGTDDAFPIEIYGDLDSTVEVENVEATSVATRIVFDEDDFELHLGAESAGGAVTYQALTAPAAGGFGPQVVTDIYSGAVNAVQTGGFLNIQLGLQGAGLAVGGTDNVGNLDRTQASPAINNASGLILAFNRRDLDNTLTEDDFVEVVTVRNDTDSNGNRARIRTDLVDAANFSAADYIALGTNVPLYFRSTGGSTTPDPNQVIVRAKAQQTDPLILQGRNVADDANVGSSITDAVQLNVVAPLEVSSTGTTATLTVDTLSTNRLTGNTSLELNAVNTIDGPFTGTIPPNPRDGDIIIVKNIGAVGDTAFVSSASAGTTVDGDNSNIRLEQFETIEIVYSDEGINGTAGWVKTIAVNQELTTIRHIAPSSMLQTYAVNTLENGVTGILPTDAVDGDFVIIKNISAGFRFVNPNGNEVDGVTGNFTINQILESVTLVWSDGGIEGTAGWIRTSSHVPTVAQTGPQLYSHVDNRPTNDSDTGASTWSVTHNLNNFNPIVQVYEETANASGNILTRSMIIPDTITIVSANQLTITFSTNVAGTSTVLG